MFFLLEMHKKNDIEIGMMCHWRQNKLFRKHTSVPMPFQHIGLHPKKIGDLKCKPHCHNFTCTHENPLLIFSADL